LTQKTGVLGAKICGNLHRLFTETLLDGLIKLLIVFDLIILKSLKNRICDFF